jgi:hypothetical protein
VRFLLIVSVLCLAVGVGLIFYFCHGSTGFSFAYPLAASSLHLDVTTSGAPAVIGVGLTGLGGFSLAIAWLGALFGSFKRGDTPKRREEPFRTEPFQE